MPFDVKSSKIKYVQYKEAFKFENPCYAPEHTYIVYKLYSIAILLTQLTHVFLILGFILLISIFLSELYHVKMKTYNSFHITLLLLHTRNTAV